MIGLCQVSIFMRIPSIVSCVHSGTNAYNSQAHFTFGWLYNVS